MDTAIRKRFCKDLKLPLKLFSDPYFADRLELFDAADQYSDYTTMLADMFNTNHQDYLEYYNKVKDKAIDYIKNSEAFKDLNSTDMQKFAKQTNYPDKELYKDYNIGRKFISIDIQKANFSALVHYGLTFNKDFFPSYDYEEFIRQFTKIDHIINSKYIRQVIFGNCNPKRQITYEAFLMDGLLRLLLSMSYINDTDVFALRADEIILYSDQIEQDTVNQIKSMIDKYTVPLHFEQFTLKKIEGSKAFIKRVDNKYELKCVNPDEAPFIYRFMHNEEYQDSDFIFEYNGNLARFLHGPNLKLIG